MFESGRQMATARSDMVGSLFHLDEDLGGDYEVEPESFNIDFEVVSDEDGKKKAKLREVSWL